ncbi:hypothetical protein X994_6291 (plasmid) [Burkholderia pseudomallei]|nr:hypothetical protein X994_6291 [Burkholderia pseudomallei]
MHGLFWLQVMTVAQQQPATGLQNLAGRLVMSQLVGLIRTCQKFRVLRPVSNLS